ncbi:MAG: InlB B-repeat-containing protein, partial [Firmicutes bacterium]|nr:InlB B-repeat-containing protein [Bacillota bacterium]
MKSIKGYVFIVLVLMASLVLGCAIPASLGLGVAGAADNQATASVASDAVATPSAITTNADGYGELENGTKYYYTDVDKIDAFRANPSSKTDYSSQEVTINSSNRGTAANPYVISTVTQWKQFAEDSNAAVANKVFVLGADIDFGSVASNFIPVPNLSAKFYGRNYILKNITYDFNNNYNGGVFRITADTAVIADLGVDNLVFTNVKRQAGGIVANNKAPVLNCHVRGRISGNIEVEYGTTGVTYDYGAGCGGIVGRNYQTTKCVTIYRCSSFMNFNIASSGAGPVAGILGSVGDTTGGVHVYDCFTITNNTFSGKDAVWFGGVVTYDSVGYDNKLISLTNQKLENVVSFSKIQDNADARHSAGSLFNGWVNTSVTSGPCTAEIDSIDIKNTYTAGRLQVTTMGEKDIYANLFYNNNNNFSRVNSVIGSNINWYCVNPYASSTKIPTDSIEVFIQLGTSSTATKQYSNRSTMYSAVQTDTNFKDEIWVNKSIIDDAYMTQTNVDLTTGYTIENSPVRSRLPIQVQYRNRTKTGSNVLITGNDNNWFEITSLGQALADPDNTGDNKADSNHVFEGWATDTDGNNIVTNVDGMRGSVVLYATWSVKDDSKILAVADKTTEVYGGNIKLSVSATIDKMSSSNMKITSYKWYKVEDSTPVGTDSGYTVSTVNQSGKYYVEYVLHDESEPLWRHSGTSGQVEVTITPTPVYYQSMSYGTGQHPYVGMPMEDLTPMPVVTYPTSSGNKTVPGTAIWAGNDLFIDVADEDIDGDSVADLKMKRKFTFTPDDNNYQTLTDYEVELDVEYLTMSFNLPGTLGEIKANLEYNQNYSFRNVAELFDKAHQSSTITLPNGRVPQLNVNKMNYKIDALRTNNNVAYTNVKDNISINVEFITGSYTVTFDPDNGTDVTVQTGFTYGQMAIKPDNPTNGVMMFLGWYYDVYDDNGNKIDPAKWDFSVNRVTEDTVLTAHWLKAESLDRIEVIANNSSYAALQPVKAGDLTVTAVFIGKNDLNQNVEMPVVLSWDEYKDNIEYLDNVLPTDKVLHVNSTAAPTRVKVSYSYTNNGTTYNKDDTANLVVTQVKIDISDLVIDDDQYAIYDGTVKDIVKPDLTAVRKLNDKNSQYIDDITYTYYKDRNIVDADTVIERGVYNVLVGFYSSNPDFKVDPVSVTFTIQDEDEVLSVTWDSTTFVYNGKQQYPTPTFKKANGDTATVKYTVSGVDNAINADTYTITITLTTGGYSIKSGEESTNFTITKASLAAPTPKDADIIYKGENIFIADHLDGFNPDIMEIVSVDKGLNAGNYSTVIKFKSSAAGNCSWQGGGATVTVKWEIKKATAIADWGSNYKFVWDGSDHHPELVGILDVFTVDQPAVDLTKLVYEGDINVADMGAYTITVRVPSSEDWFKNYTLENTSYDFVIVPSDNVELVSVVWENLVLVYNGEVQAPSYTVVDMDGNPVSADVLASIEFDIPLSKWAGDYTAKANVKAGANYFIRSGGTCAYKITTDAQGAGADPGANDGSGDGENFIDKLLASHFPLWQVATMAVAGVLSIIFIAKAAQYGSRAKKAKGEAKKYNAKAYASILPIFSTEAVALGLSNKIWSIIAFAVAGFCLLMLVVMLLNRSRWKKAEAAMEAAIENSEQRRVKAEKEEREAEKQERIAFQERMVQVGGSVGAGDSSLFEQRLLEMEARHREEMERRDEAMKMMLANLMGGRQQGDDGFAYAAVDDTDMLVQRVIAGLLPAMQQMMPEATAYLAAPQEQNDELISLVEEQKALMEEQRAIVEEQNDQIRNMAEAHSEEMQAMSAQISELQEQLAAAMSQEHADAVILPDNNDELMAEIGALREQIANLGAQADNSDSDEVAAKIDALQKQIASLNSSAVPAEVDVDEIANRVAERIPT